MCSIPLGLSIASAAAGGVSAFSQAQGQKSMARYQAQVAENNAQVAEWQAQDAERRGEREAQAARRQGAQLKGTQRATMAARGLDLGVGSAAGVLDDTEFFTRLDQHTARENASKEAWQARIQGRNLQNQASQQRTAAGNANPGLSGGLSLLGSAGSVANIWNKEFG